MTLNYIFKRTLYGGLLLLALSLICFIIVLSNGTFVFLVRLILINWLSFFLCGRAVLDNAALRDARIAAEIRLLWLSLAGALAAAMLYFALAYITRQQILAGGYERIGALMAIFFAELLCFAGALRLAVKRDIPTLSTKALINIKTIYATAALFVGLVAIDFISGMTPAYFIVGMIIDWVEACLVLAYLMFTSYLMCSEQTDEPSRKAK